MSNSGRHPSWPVILLAEALLGFSHVTAQARPNPDQANVQGGSTPAASASNLKVHVPLVVEDLVVLDHEGRPVHGLKTSDLTVTENGKQVQIRSFEEHSTTIAQTSAQANLPDLGPNVFTNLVATPASDSLDVLLFDALNTPMTDQAAMREQMLEYLKTLPGGYPVAVFGLSGQLYMLQGFTSDPKTLASAIEASQKMIHASAGLDNPVANEPNRKMSDFVTERLDLSDSGVLEMLANIRQFELENQVAQTAQRVQETLQALNQLGRYLSGFPGRKNLIWFSGSFPLNYLPDNTQAQEFMAVADFQDDVRKTTDLLARSQVAVYPVDGRGLFTNGALNASQSDQGMAKMAASRPTPVARSGPGLFHTPSSNPEDQPGTFSSSARQFLATISAEHATMTEMAENTGGKAFFDTNALKDAVGKAIDDGSNYYTITYTPPGQKFDGSYRRVEVKVDLPELRLSYRKAYFADDPDSAWHGRKVLPQSAMQAAMMFGAPSATQIQFAVQATPEDAPVNKSSPGTKPNSKLMKSPYRRYDVTYVVDIHNVLFSATSDGGHRGNFEFAIVVYDSNGEVLNQAGNRIDLDLPPDKYAEILERGLHVSQAIEAPLNGDYFLRIGICDLAGDRIGAIEIPSSSVKPANVATTGSH